MASAAYERRNAAARAKGYTSYYDYRAHGNGKRPPGAPRLTGGELRKARGHASAYDLRKDVRAGQLVTITPDPTSRNKDGTYGKIIVTLVGQFEGDSDKTYTLQGAALKPGALEKLVADLIAAGAVLSPSPSMNVAAGGDDEGPADLEQLSDEELAELNTDQSYDDIPF